MKLTALRAACLAIGLGILAACTGMETSQPPRISNTLSIVTNPQGAACKLYRQSKLLYVVNSTPAYFDVSPSQFDIALTCTHPGYQTGTTMISSVDTADGFANSAAENDNNIGDIIAGILLDQATAMNRAYLADVTLTLLPNPHSQMTNPQPAGPTTRQPPAAAPAPVPEAAPESMATYADDESLDEIYDPFTPNY